MCQLASCSSRWILRGRWLLHSAAAPCRGAVVPPGAIHSLCRPYVRDVRHLLSALSDNSFPAAPAIGNVEGTVRYSSVESKRFADSVTVATSADSTAVTPTDSPEEYCNEILSDPLSDVSVEESARFVVPFPNSDRPHLLEVITRPFRKNYTFGAASIMLHLCVERLENEELTEAFEIGPGFNRRAYLLFLHVWLLHRRAMKECPLGILLDRYLFRCAFELLGEWLTMRGVAEHRFKRERENCQAFMMKFLVELDQCTLDEELYAFLSRALLPYVPAGQSAIIVSGAHAPDRDVRIHRAVSCEVEQRHSRVEPGIRFWTCSVRCLHSDLNPPRLFFSMIFCNKLLLPSVAAFCAPTDGALMS
ncbi:ubiquinol-cytochrome c, putative [Babesia ovata]|uniref:Ubiquinol-cytochrome c, putative n=1 Tax=Babesia ovata TaxID=189622 RepID=A0A2H6K802_9APIC|nr:ubiquinol-cytochrome c, putative [Babesia ovata]GBE59132.1 ubiquinol-cytochrome c, putative [Babesia ovata]